MISFILFFFSAPAHAVAVVCTLPWLGDITKRVAPQATVSVLARGTDDPHYLSPTPSLMATVGKANLYVENGLSLELWSERLLDSAGNPSIRPGAPGYVKATDGMTRLDVPADISRSKGDMHPDGNPHVWTDPLNAPQAADNIAAGLSRVDPANAATYTNNAKAFRNSIYEATFGPDLVKFMGGDLLARLEQSNKLDAFLATKGLTARLGGWLAQGAALNRKPIVFYHASWAYFINRFGIDAVGYVEDRPGIQPTAAHRDELLGLMRAKQVKVIAVTTYYDRKIPDLLAPPVGARVEIVPGDVGGTTAASDYFSFITSLVTAMAK
jgi:zinc/manganese transport system substrate-binding protein